MATFYGSDTSVISDVSLVDSQVTDPLRIIGERLARRLQTPYGALAAINDDADFGYDVRELLNAKVTPVLLGQARERIEAQCKRDEQVSAASADLTFSGSALTVKIEVIAAEGEFTLTLNVQNLTTEAVFNFNG